jgi:hypothetical protein
MKVGIGGLAFRGACRMVTPLVRSSLKRKLWLMQRHGETISLGGEKMKRLFAVRDQADKIVSDFVDKKAEAKQKRNELGANSHYVTLGPDHWRKSLNPWK